MTIHIIILYLPSSFTGAVAQLATRPPVPYGTGGECLTEIRMKVYIIQSEADQSYYIGMSAKPELRLHQEHNKGKVKSTKTKIPWKLVLVEEFESRIEARKREKYLKSAAGRKYRKKLLGP